MSVKERFKNWTQPFIVHRVPTIYNWLVDYPKGLELSKYVDIGAFTYIMARSGVVIEENVEIGSHCSIYSENTINNTKGRVVIKKGARIGSHSIILPGVVIEEGEFVKAFSVRK